MQIFAFLILETSFIQVECKQSVFYVLTCYVLGNAKERDSAIFVALRFWTLRPRFCIQVDLFLQDLLLVLDKSLKVFGRPYLNLRIALRIYLEKRFYVEVVKVSAH